MGTAALFPIPLLATINKLCRSQGPDNHSFLPAMNSGSGEISSFRVHGATLELADIVPSGGSKPVSVAQHGNLVCVVNAGGNSSVAGFRLAGNGNLTQIPHSIAFLSTSNSGPGSDTFSPEGQFLVVTEKTNNIDFFRVEPSGRLGPIVVNPSAGPGVFALLFAPNGAALAFRDQTSRRCAFLLRRPVERNTLHY